MTNPEFFYEFDILYNSICSNQAPELNAYEKSVILTLAQEELVKEWYSGVATSFERTEELRRSLDGLVKFTSILPNKEFSVLNGTIYKLPEDLWFITYETVKVADADNVCLNNTVLSVVPITQDEYNRVKNNPFRGPNRRQALRLDTSKSEVTLISNNPLGTYTIGYVSNLNPIILEDLSSEGLTINGMSEECECQLNSVTHRIILEKAVNIARSIYLKQS